RRTAGGGWRRTAARRARMHPGARRGSSPGGGPRGGWRRERAHAATGGGPRGNREVPPCAASRVSRGAAGRKRRVSTARRGLGRGLEILVGGAGDGPELAQVRVDDIRPNARQPRRRFEPEATTGLAESIRHQGLLQPVVVRPRPAGGYELIAGERRWRAAKEAGVDVVPALVREAD